MGDIRGRLRRLFWFLVWVGLRIWAVGCKRIMICAPDGTPYLERWKVWPGVYLHRFHQSDPDRGLHCHPWVWCESRILRGAYYQQIMIHGQEWPGAFNEAQVYIAGDKNMLLGETRSGWAGDFHAVRLLDTPVWTLFKYGPRHGLSWGFKTKDGVYTKAGPGDGQCPGQPDPYRPEPVLAEDTQ